MTSLLSSGELAWPPTSRHMFIGTNAFSAFSFVYFATGISFLFFSPFLSERAIQAAYFCLLFWPSVLGKVWYKNHKVRVHFHSLCDLLTSHRIFFLPPSRSQLNHLTVSFCTVRWPYALSRCCPVDNELSGAVHVLVSLWVLSHFWKTAAPSCTYHLWSLWNFYVRVTGPCMMWAYDLGLES